MTEEPTNQYITPYELLDQKSAEYEDILFQLAMGQVQGVQVTSDEAYLYLGSWFGWLRAYKISEGKDPSQEDALLNELNFSRQTKTLTPRLRQSLEARIHSLTLDPQSTPSLQESLEYLKGLPSVARAFDSELVNPKVVNMLADVLDKHLDQKKYLPLTVKTLQQALALFEA